LFTGVVVVALHLGEFTKCTQLAGDVQISSHYQLIWAFFLLDGWMDGWMFWPKKLECVSQFFLLAQEHTLVERPVSKSLCCVLQGSMSMTPIGEVLSEATKSTQMVRILVQRIKEAHSLGTPPPSVFDITLQAAMSPIEDAHRKKELYRKRGSTKRQRLMNDGNTKEYPSSQR
jgi:hypothetical protein